MVETPTAMALTEPVAEIVTAEVLIDIQVMSEVNSLPSYQLLLIA
jgi:hypothetical protein